MYRIDYGRRDFAEVHVDNPALLPTHKANLGALAHLDLGQFRSSVPVFLYGPVVPHLKGWFAEALGDMFAGLVPADAVESLVLTPFEFNKYISGREFPPLPEELAGCVPGYTDMDRTQYDTLVDYLLETGKILVAAVLVDTHSTVYLQSAPAWHAQRAKWLTRLWSLAA